MTATKTRPTPQFKWQSKGQRESEGKVVDKVQYGNGPWPIASVRKASVRKGGPWRVTFHWWSKPREGFPSPTLPEPASAEERDGARAKAQELLAKLAPALREYHAWLEARRAATAEANRKEREEKDAASAHNAALSKRVAEAYPGLIEVKEGYTRPWCYESNVLVNTEALARLLLDDDGPKLLDAERALFEAYREWMKNDAGGGDLAEAITNRRGFSEWSEKHWGDA